MSVSNHLLFCAGVLCLSANAQAAPCAPTTTRAQEQEGAALSAPKLPTAIDSAEGAAEEENRSLPLSLDAALTISATNSLGLLLEDVTTEVARFNAKGAWGNFDWVFGGNAQYTDFRRNPISTNQGTQQLKGTTEFLSVNLTRPLETGGSFSAEFVSDRTETNQANAISPSETSDEFRLSFSQPLLRGFGIDRGTSEQRESDVLYLQQLERRREILQGVLRDTANAYWDMVQAGRQLGVAESSLELGREQLQRNRRLLEAGVGTEIEVIQAEAEVAKRGETRLGAEVAVQIAEDALRAFLFPGTDPINWETELVPTTDLPADVSVENLPDWTKLIDGALRHRPEMRQMEMEMTLAKLRHERSVSDRRYGVDFNTSINSQGREPSWSDAKAEVFELEAVTWLAGLSLDAPIRNRTRVNAERAARAQMRAARIRFEQQETAVVSEIRDAVRQLRYQSLAVQAAGESMRAARRQLEAEQARYENDLSTNIQVLESQLRLVEAMNNEQTARANYAKAIYQLRAAKGTLGEGHESDR